MGFRPTAKEGH